MTEPVRRGDDRVENRLQAFEAREDAQHLCDRPLLFAQLILLTREIFPRHAAGSSGAIVKPKCLSSSQ